MNYKVTPSFQVVINWISSVKGLMLQTSVLESLYCGQITGQTSFFVNRLRLPGTFRGVLRLRDVACPVYLNCRYLNPYIKLKVIELTIKPYQEL